MLEITRKNCSNAICKQLLTIIVDTFGLILKILKRKQKESG